MIKDKAVRRTVRNTTALFVAGTTLVACAATPAEQAELDKHKPALPSIEIYDNGGSSRGTILRHCDGTTLLYVTHDYRGGVAAIPNSPLCPAT